jgi:hypothetical protein
MASEWSERVSFWSFLIIGEVANFWKVLAALLSIKARFFGTANAGLPETCVFFTVHQLQSATPAKNLGRTVWGANDLFATFKTSDAITQDAKEGTNERYPKKRARSHC